MHGETFWQFFVLTEDEQNSHASASHGCYNLDLLMEAHLGKILLEVGWYFLVSVLRIAV